MILLGLGVAAASPRLRATTYVWKGGGGNNDWSNPANWVGGVAPPPTLLSDNDLVFGATGAPFPSISGAYYIRTLTFSAGADAYTFDSGPLTLGTGGINQNAAAAQGFSTAQVFLGASQTWTLASGAGALTFGAGLNTTGGPFGGTPSAQALTINAATTTGPGNVINGAITGGGSLTKTGAGILTLTGNSSYSGGTTISAGTLAVTNGNALGSGGIGLGAELRGASTVTLANAITTATNAGGTISATTGNTLTLTGLMTLGGGSTLNVGSTGNAGTVVFSPANGSAVGSGNALSLNVNAGTLQVGNANVSTLTQAANVTLASGTTFDMNGQNVTMRYLQGTGAVTTGTNTGGVLTLGGAFYGGSISGVGGLTVASSTSAVLYGASTYTGNTTVNSGTLAVFGGSLNGSSFTNVRGGGNLSILGGGSVTTASGGQFNVFSTTTTPATASLSGNGSSLTTDTTTVGASANVTDAFTQDGGTHTTTSLQLGLTAGGGGTYTLSGATSQLTTRSTLVGANGTGTFTQNDGTHTTGVVVNGNTILGGLFLGNFSNSSGTYNLNGGTLASQRTYVGFASSSTASTFTQTGGTHTVNNALAVGSGGGSSGTYTLSGSSSQLSTFNTLVGDAGTGTFTQNGGTHTIGANLLMGSNGGTGTYTLNGGTLTTGFGVTVGSFNGSATFNHEGGTITANLGVRVGGFNASGTYHLDGGTLQADNVAGNLAGPNGNTATFYFNGGTLQALNNNGSFVSGLTNAYVSAGGAIINTANPGGAATSVTVSQTLGHDPAVGAGLDGGLAKRGGGTLSLTGANTYTGATVVEGGTLLANNTTGSATGTGRVTVRTGATLGGSGSIAGDVTVNNGATLSPGNSPGRLTLGGTLGLGSSATLLIELGGTTPGTGYDQVLHTGTLTLGGNLRVDVINGFGLTPGQKFFILDGVVSTSLVSGTFANAPAGLFTDARGDTFLVNYADSAGDGSNGNDVSLMALTVVPEPATWALISTGLLTLLGLQRRRSSRHAKALT